MSHSLVVRRIRANGRRTKATQRQVARRHPVIKGNGVTTVNTAAAAAILAQSQGSLLIHVPDWESFPPCV